MIRRRLASVCENSVIPPRLRYHAAARVRLSIKIIGTARIRQLDIIKNKTFVYTRQNLDREVAFSYEDAPTAAGESYYYVRVIQTNEQMAWSSPIWVGK